MFIKSSLGLLGLSLFSSTALAASCKCTPHSKCWPAENEWKKLNETISGKLIKTVPLAAVCHSGGPFNVYNQDACTALGKKWTNPLTHTEDPSSILFSSWAKDSCIPVTDPNAAGCTVGEYPIYVIDARTTEDVQAGVNFAREKNVRLVIKNTGHDFYGKSTGANSLSIWTHHLKSRTIHDSFVPNGCKWKKGQAAITVGSGNQLKEVYTALNEKNLVIVAGTDMSVGIGGYLQGGGHGPMSAKYGLAVDQVLETTIVTPDGKLVVANECQNTEIFWATRGGGGGTWGVLISATLKTFPSPKIAFALYTANLTTSSTNQFWDAIGSIFTDVPRLMDNGLMGYLYIINYGSSYSFNMIVNMVDQTPQELDSVMAPVVERMNTTYKADFGLSGYKVPPMQFPSYFAYWSKILDGQAPLRPYALFPSRLIPKESLTADKKDFIAQKLSQAGAKGHTVLAVGLLAGKGVAQHAGNDLAVNPAWRKAYIHMFSSIIFPNEEPGRSQAFQRATDVYEQALIDIAPDSGAYVNEGNPFTKNPGKTFYGKNYPRLLALKKKIDPNGVLYCRTCVGSEDYVEKDGAICKKDVGKRDDFNRRRS